MRNLMQTLTSNPAIPIPFKYKLVFAAALVLYLAAFVGAHIVSFKELTYPLFDDGMITLEYAKNLARHGVLTVGGDSQWTAGFTSWVWMLLLALLALIPVSELHLPFLVPVLNIVLLFFALRIFARLSTELSGQPVGWVYWGLVLTTPSILFWTLRGMEVPLSMLAIAIIASSVVALSKKENPDTSDLLKFLGASLVVPFVRPELAAVVLMCALYIYLIKRKHVVAISAVILLVSGFLAYAIVNKLVFNQYFSNSYFLKIEGVTELQKLSRGIWSVVTQLIHNLPYMLIFFAVIVIFARKRKQKISGLLHHLLISLRSALRNSIFSRNFFETSPYAVVVLIIAASILSWIWVGGDAWEELPLLNRFLVVCVPLGYLFFDKLSRSINTETQAISLAVIICFISLNTFYSIKTIELGAFNDKKFSYIGFQLGELFGSDVVAMHYWYGQPSYYSSINQGKSIDSLGKIDPVVSRSHPMLSFKPGHDRWNHAHSIGKLKPDIIVNLPCPAPHDLKFNCSTVWDEITIKYGYKPHTASDLSLTLFVSPLRPELNDAVEKFEADFVKFNKNL